MKKKNNEVESKLHRVGIPSAYVGVTAIIVYYVCNSIGACA